VPLNDFQFAAARATASYTSMEWLSFTPQQRTAAIYRELRKLDQLSVRDRELRAEPALSQAERQ
jgi:hypothetical protein